MNSLDFLQALVAFIVVLGILVTVHEFGHFWVARRAGIKVLRFSVGFGPPIWSTRFGADNTEFVIAAVPLGGYVRMLDEREGEVEPEERKRAFNRQSLGKRTAVVAAGPIFNFLLAIVAYWIMYTVGVPGLKPVVGEVTEGSPADKAGMMIGQEIISIDGRLTPTWEAVAQSGLTNLVADNALMVKVKDGEQFRNLSIDLSSISLDDIAESGLFEKIGMRPMRPKIDPVINKIIKGGAAEHAGLQSGDRVVQADGIEIADWRSWVDYVRERPGQRIDVLVERNNTSVHLLITPERIESDSGTTYGRIGASVVVPADFGDAWRVVERHSVVQSLIKGIVRTGEMSLLTLRVMGKIVTGNASVRNLSGPISIAEYAGRSVDMGASAFLAFLAIVSISLGVINLLPIPLLDGGHLMYYLIELLKGSPVSEAVQLRGQQFGIAVLLGVMSLAIYNDLARLLG